MAPLWAVVALLPLLSLAEELLLPTNSSAGLLGEEVVLEEVHLRDEEHPLVTLLETSPHAMSLLIKPLNYHPDTMVTTPGHHNNIQLFPPYPQDFLLNLLCFPCAVTPSTALPSLGICNLSFSRFLPWCTMATALPHPRHLNYPISK